ncbi:hypothetical protein GUI51_05550 [Enterococcus mundtii]|uniref:ATP-binding protein n=1 Tax=Enterococcus mundtii TaxID=53346 RepID=UPI001020D0E9|nr:ATP-binding protein [Enterococcus mundtii]MZU11609.1 hypothetical protein [Bifidobacterium longum]MZZ58582.1 hypothetical protein [Enterococcus mundtii]MZZ62367.1 hypothetical protein [Enterococcus mundtii]MZZ68542.1 hypothetical protein [Enterococcus mundtii]MZZ97211.1 hypothetical protein [Enterococcus mundtii]
MNETIPFTVANNSVTHLGRNLYSTTPPALAELVANSYDAYAKNVDIILSGENIIIADDGKGLNLNELKSKYAKIGKRKDRELPPHGMDERKPMGKKGIGKLAAFSLGEKYSVYTKVTGENKWRKFSLDYNEMIDTSDDKYNVPIMTMTELPITLKKYEHFDHGFIVEITDLRRKVISKTLDNIKVQLSRRFYLINNKVEFNLNINDELIKLDTNKYYDKIQYLLYFGYNEENIKKIFDSTKVQIEEYKQKQEIIDFIKANDIKGWIGSVTKPKILKEDGNDFTNIIVYINGKIADEDILKSKGDSRIANQYIVGEIQADYFDNDIFDPITSSRQGLDDSLEVVDSFIRNIEVIRNYVIKRWDEIRNDNAVESLPEKIKNHPSYKQWLETLSKEQKSINNKMLSFLTPKLDDGTDINDRAVETMVTSIANVINNVEITEIEKALECEDDYDKYNHLLSELMNNVAKVENIKHSDLILARLGALDKLEKLMEDQATSEKIFEKHLADNPWILNPYWNIDRNKTEEEKELITQKYYKFVHEDGQSKGNFLDILIHVAEESFPIIVELKKNTPTGHANVKYTTIYDQISRYRNAIIQNTPEFKDIDPIEIKAVFVLSEDSGVEGSGNKIELTEREINKLEQDRITLVKYSELLRNARRMYREHLSVIRSTNTIPFFNDEIAD